MDEWLERLLQALVVVVLLAAVALLCGMAVSVWQRVLQP